MTNLIDGLESRLQQRLDHGLNALLAALPAFGAPNPDRDRDVLRRATAALGAVTSLASQSTATARLTALVEGTAAQLAAQELVPRSTPDLNDLDTRDSARAARFDDMSQSRSPLQAQDEVQRPASNQMTSLASDARTGDTQGVETQTLPSDASVPQDNAEPPTATSPGFSDLPATAPTLAPTTDDPVVPTIDPAADVSDIDQYLSVADTVPDVDDPRSVESHPII